MKAIQKILNESLQDIQPDRNYEKEIFEKLNHIIKKINQNQKGIKAVLGGSGAKGTWLKTFDADIFALFNYSRYKDKSGKISDILESVLKKKFGKVARIHGSRDYFQIKEEKFTFEIIPILKISKAEQAKNITDVSPLHSKWVMKHKKLVNEMKLTKQFCKANNVYGAESHIRGFSGYVCEILTAYYGSFLKLVKNASKWQDKVVIDAAKYYRGKDVFKIVNISKLLSPLIVIDPVQKDRNAAAALSAEKFEAFKKAAREFLKMPSKEFFEKKDLRAAFLELRSNSCKLIEVHAEPLEGKADVVGSKLMKIYEYFLQKLQNHEFKMIKSGWEWDKSKDAAFYFLLVKELLPENIEIEGPPAAIKHHAGHFKKIHKNTYIKNKKIYAAEKRKYVKPEELLKSLANDEFVKERSKSIKIINFA
ncbi:CCA tRNA nucleotidyltransferase [Candidatus Woesearchaeota archaeon]|nr:CCA tRNA nucleotidyltransferase [Candidatus Woesearchaeota archaeon]